MLGTACPLTQRHIPEDFYLQDTQLL